MHHREKKMTHVKSGNTTMVDIYEAAGGLVSEDRTMVSIDASKQHPFEIVLRVYPTTHKMGVDGETITFGVLLDDEMMLEHGPGGTLMHHLYFDAEVTLPVSQVKILKKEEA